MKKGEHLLAQFDQDYLTVSGITGIDPQHAHLVEEVGDASGLMFEYPLLGCYFDPNSHLNFTSQIRKKTLMPLGRHMLDLYNLN